MTIDTFMSNEAVLQEIGRSMARRRVELELTQAALAEQAGVAKRTVERIEAGLSIQTANLIRIFRVLGLIEGLAVLIPETGPRPLDLLKLKGKQRQRVSAKKTAKSNSEPWTWGEDL
jgi:transcriptional regulator with XRE-family HTH domain